MAPGTMRPRVESSKRRRHEGENMKRLSGLDTFFLATENKRQHMHVAALGIYDPSTAPGGKVRFKSILEFFEQRAQEIEPFRRRLVRAPLGLDRAHWIEDGDIDVEYHVRHLRLPEPGDWRQLMIQVARLHSRPMDLTLPPWEAYIIEGLDNIPNFAVGSFALYLKIHHVAVDGEAGVRILKAIHSTSPEPEPLESGRRVHYVEREPTDFELLARAVVNRATQVRDAAAFLVSAGQTGLRLVAQRANQAIEARPKPEGESPGRKPDTRFGALVSPHRVVDGLGLALADFRSIRRAVEGATLNDVFMCTVGGALNRYLASHGEQPKSSLNAIVPIAFGEPGKGTSAENRFALAIMPLHSDIADPLERLAAVSRAATASKSLQSDLGLDLGLKLMNVVPIFAAVALANRTVRDQGNLVVSNVRGPDVPLYMAGARMQMFMPINIPTDKVTLSVTGFSYAGTLWVCAVACRNVMPDPAFFTQCIRESFDELRDAAEKSLAKPAKPAKTSKTSKTSKTAKTAKTAEAGRGSQRKTRGTPRRKQKPARKSGT
jgi:diacylglycerol O-acyltransferase